VIQPHHPTPPLRLKLCSKTAVEYSGLFGIYMMLPGQRRPYGRAAKAMRPAHSEVKRCGQQVNGSKWDIMSDAASPHAARKRSTERHSKRNRKPSDNRTKVTRALRRRMLCMYKRPPRIGNQVPPNSLPFAIIRSLHFGQFSTHRGGTCNRSPLLLSLLRHLDWEICCCISTSSYWF
jgi:hypothetical protein